MRKLLAGLALALAALTAWAQPTIFTVGAVGVGAQVVKGTANSVLFVGSTGLLAQDNTNFNYTTTSGPMLQIGSTGTSSGWKIGYGQASGASSLYHGSVTPSATNYALLATTTNTHLNAPSGASIFVKINDTSVLTIAGASVTAAQPISVTPGTDDADKVLLYSSGFGLGMTSSFVSLWGTNGVKIGTARASGTKLQINSTAGEGLLVTAGTATTDVAALSVTRTNNNAAVVKGVEFSFTDTTSNASFLPLNVLGGAAGSTSLFKVDKSGNATFAAQISISGNNALYFRNTGIVGLGVNGLMTFSSGNDGATGADTGISRVAAGSIGFGTGAQGNTSATISFGAGVVAASGTLLFSGRSYIYSSKDGELITANNANTRKVVLQFTGTPTCSSNCGTSPSVVGVDSAGTVTMGASGSPASGWVLTFNGTWSAAPSCSVTPALATMAVGKLPIAVVTTTTTMTVTTNGTAPANSDVYKYQCTQGV
jgi:hypothetical protein